jgi:hypothetical protein
MMETPHHLSAPTGAAVLRAHRISGPPSSTPEPKPWSWRRQLHGADNIEVRRLVPGAVLKLPLGGFVSADIRLAEEKSCTTNPFLLATRFPSKQA